MGPTKVTMGIDVGTATTRRAAPSLPVSVLWMCKVVVRVLSGVTGMCTLPL
ncbi:hypothetical protein JCM18916_45 [Cutibacterium acnes JCM 18916]|nr:hypothetical protein HMPREF9206_2063 [Cutibacterium acnes J139]EFD03165.1 hypothetical protein HMPREF1034_0086 [Cutibacterium acnes SK187]MCW5106825.1 hypothetical protein [Cutibacterium acnes P07A]GAE70766.1 hypothetical protein JCM18916_45 [Cutibacterium acnes JCM 18916]GAE76058.1 hypothetical protein JCM18918_1814 [Cutibacterium acnes JCM 18918]GAE79008.1 hypothetical protein JCM18920_548 [Cutibacterium acnes JCM 18920]